MPEQHSPETAGHSWALLARRRHLWPGGSKGPKMTYLTAPTLQSRDSDNFTPWGHLSLQATSSQLELFEPLMGDRAHLPDLFPLEPVP